MSEFMFRLEFHSYNIIIMQAVSSLKPEIQNTLDLNHFGQWTLEVTCTGSVEVFFFSPKERGGKAGPHNSSNPKTHMPRAAHTSKRRGLYTVSGSSMWPRCPEQLLKSCTQVEHTSLESAGPNAKSYRPFAEGFPRLSTQRGLVMDLTLNFLRRLEKKSRKSSGY